MKEDDMDTQTLGTLGGILFLLMVPFIALIYLLLYLTGRLNGSPSTEGEIVVVLYMGDNRFIYHLPLNSVNDFKEIEKFMQNVKATTPDTEFGIDIVGAADAEGNPIPVSKFNVSTPVSDNVGAVEILDWDSSTRRGNIRWGTSNPDGTPNVANLTANVLNEDGSVAAVIGEQIAVVHGDVASFEGGFNFNFVEETPTEEEPTEEEPTEGDTEIPAPTDGETETGDTTEEPASGEQPNS